MPSISILPESLINKIAAGEVIERPASIVRELLDNSIDAGAKTISVEVLHGGKKLIKVSDDGIGMEREDALLCFERHATSKIKSEEDIFNITTLGFRGEALSSIAAVSRFTLITSTKDSAGTRIEIGMNKKEIADAPAVQGTVVEVRDIFYNIPARRKFLKSTATEISHIIETITQKALAYPEIRFSLKHNNAEIINVSAINDLKGRFIQLYGEDLFKEFVEIEKGIEGIRLYGFSSNMDFIRSSKSHQLIFINRRPVKNPTISHAVYNAYSDLIPKDKHPSFFLFLDIDPKRVDVNVHPAKREVRFESPDEVYKLVFSAIREKFHSLQHKGIVYSPVETIEGEATRSFIREAVESAFQLSESAQTDFFVKGITPPLHRYFYIGESFFVELSEGGITIIDQHAAHERVLYERFLKKVYLEIETLFLPIRIELPVREFNIIMNYKWLLQDFGFQIEEFGANNFIIRALPKVINKAELKGLLLDIASAIVEEGASAKGVSQKEELSKSIAAKLACHRSVRGRERLTNEELSKLIAELEKTDTPDKCPHGRPTRISFSLNDLRKMFKRC